VRRRDFLRGNGALLALLGGGTLLSACGGDETGTGGGGGGAAEDGRLSIRVVQDLQSLDPAFMTSSIDDAIMVCVAENLVTYAAGSDEVVNELAEEITSSEDGLTHTFTLKDGMQFHGGYGAVTADDVKFSFERIAGLTDPPLESTYQGDWATLTEVEVTGDLTGVIHLSAPFPPLFTTTLTGNAGLVISRAAYQELGDGFATQPIGSGPYEFSAWERGQRVLLSRFADWQQPSAEWAEEPAWEEIEFLPIPEDNSADIAIETGQVDFGQIAYSSVRRFQDDGQFAVTTQPTLDYAFIGFNVTDPPLADVEVRRALRQALDVDSMLVAAFDGQTTRAHCLLSADMPIGHWADAPQHQSDPEAAQQALAAAGAEGLELEFGIREEPGSAIIAQIVQENLSAIGVTVTIQVYPGDELHQQVENLQMFYQSFSNQADPSWATVWFTGPQIGDWNFMSWSNEQFDSLHEEALTETDQDLRHEMYIRMQELMEEDAIAAWVMYRTNHYAHGPDLEPSLITQRYAKYRAWAFTA
jgi:peptide/nickel transport system substrate-binding protein